MRKIGVCVYFREDVYPVRLCLFSQEQKKFVTENYTKSKQCE
ncbi:hypothetical protein CHISP_1009 [Chitinispirillum alkaliphilum]|nr:hypothetical protein CHISP_1009 [Chitinispirillum alkaliphilum]